jgi:hypothetical protein
LSELGCLGVRPRSKVSKTIYLRVAFVYTSRHLFRARESEIVGTIVEPRKGTVWRVILRTG